MAYPLNDDKAYWDKDLRFYVLTKDACNDYLGEDISQYFDNDTKYQQFIEEVSEDILEFIYSHTLNQQIPYRRYIIAKDDSIRDDIIRALLYQLRYAYRSTAHILKDMHGVNIEKGRALGINQLRGNVGIAHNAINVLQRIGLLYSGTINYPFRIEEDGTY
jgi:hypothetical protein